MNAKRSNNNGMHDITEQSNGVHEINTSNKRLKLDNEYNRDYQNKKKNYFGDACKIVSEKAYNNYAKRLKLFHVPICIRYELPCKHFDDRFSENILMMSHNARQPFDIKRKADMWCEALEVCILCITKTQYLSSTTLKDIVDIILNAHEDFSGNTISYVINKCQLVLSLHFSMHPPCLHTNIRKCYSEFLMSPIDLKENTYSNRKHLQTNNGIVDYCMNRLEEELSAESIDGPLIDKNENVPTALQKTMDGTFWKNQKLHIFETLERCDRIDRLMAVLYSITGLLQSDFAIKQAYRSANIKTKRGKLLMAAILWRDECVLSKICTQILKIYCYFVHLDYPEEHIKTMNLWFHLVMETFYESDTKSDHDYPNLGRNSVRVIKELYRIISELPHRSIVKILERIEPLYVRHQLGTLYTKTLLASDDNDIIKIFINFVKRSQWNNFQNSETPTTAQINKAKNEETELLEELIDICKRPKVPTDSKSIVTYPKYDENAPIGEDDRRLVERTLCVTVRAYLDTYSVRSVQNVLRRLNERAPDVPERGPSTRERRSYMCSDSFIKHYRSIFQQLATVIREMKCELERDDLPEAIKTFVNENFDNI